MTRSEEPGHLRLYLLIGFMTLCWSINYVVAKIALRELPALFTTGMRNSVAGLLMIPIYAFHRAKLGGQLWKWRDLPLLIGLGMCGVALNQIFFILGIARTSVSHASIMIAMTPMLVLLFASLRGQEKIGAIKIVGMVTAFTGVALLQLSPTKARGATLAGDALVFGASIAFAIFSVMGKGVTGRFNNITLNTFAYCGAGLVLVPVTWFSAQAVDFSKVSIAAWSSIAYMAIFSSIICYLIYYYALGYIPASRVSAFSYLQPLIATLVALPVLGERLSTSLLLGGAFVLTGVAITERA